MSVDPVHRLSEDFFQDPHSVYRELNEHGQVHQVEFPSGMRAWVVTGYDLAKRVFADPAISKELYGSAGEIAQANANTVLRLDPPVNDHMLYRDPPHHTRLRKIAMKALSSAVVRDFTPRIEEIAESVLDEFAGQDSVDLLTTYAYPVSGSGICEIIGIDAADRTKFQGWLATQISTADTDVKYAAAMEFEGYVHRLFDERREKAGNDLISELMSPSADGDRLDQDEILAMVNAILLGSVGTVAGLIGNAVLMMTTQPHLQDELRGDPELIPAFLEETLRYESAGNLASPRFTTQPLELGAHTIGSGEVVLVAAAAVNRDAQHFDRPDVMDVRRAENRHLAFGYGIHRCPGAALARTEARIAIAALLRRYSDISLAVDIEELRWQESLIARTLLSLPVRLEK
ncbi:cytochrome P450 [Streptomyces sp. NPDC041068]|uniref:cytochrome P450 family protein n=1 Tax=Streptomyces sp. NPDC041068 TaxID=3155130 RepID=UPI0033D40D57